MLRRRLVRDPISLVVAGLVLFLVVASVCAFLGTGAVRQSKAAPSDSPAARPLDPSAWGSDHVGQEVPEFTESGECLFCHRYEVGDQWQKNRHGQTIRDADPQSGAMRALIKDKTAGELAGAVELILGGESANRFLKRSEAYGKLDLLSVIATRRRGRRFHLSGTDDARWDTKTFASECAGCHATAVDSRRQSFSLVSLDCFVCHGAADEEHANDSTLMLLAAAREDPPRVVVSICGQCHLRTGKSKSTGRPYPNNFVAGDNLFRDFEVDFSRADDEHLNPADRHVLANIRDVVLYGQESLTCVSCHTIHESSTKKHREVKDQTFCQYCHEPGRPKKEHKIYEVHSDRCRY